jgi:hypothetical protein
MYSGCRAAAAPALLSPARLSPAPPTCDLVAQLLGAAPHLAPLRPKRRRVRDLDPRSSYGTRHVTCLSEHPLGLRDAGRLLLPTEGELERQVELIVSPLSGGVDDPRERRLADVLSDADAEARGLSLERVPQVGAEADRRLVHPFRGHRCPILREIDIGGEIG